MREPAILVDDLSKLYRLGEIGTGTISHDLNRWWHSLRGKPDPYSKLGAATHRKEAGSKDYMWAIRDVSFKVAPGEVVGIIGHNGAGKSTLLKLLSKITAPTTGRIELQGRVASLLEVGTGFHPEMTGRENAYMNGAILGMRKAEVTRKLDEIIDFAGIGAYIDTPVKRYSSGMKVRLGFAVAAYLEPEILIVDEVLAVGDAEFQKKCIGKMASVSQDMGRTILFVSHNMAAVQKLCTRGILMHQGTVVADGPVMEITASYLLTSSQEGLINFSEGIVRQILVTQEGSAIRISCAYKSESVLEAAIIGFVISDANGQKIFGSNPIHSKPQEPIRPSKSGTIEALVSGPKLLDGTYLLSLWFADEIIGVLETHEHVLQFQVMNMARFDKLPSAQVLGPVAPELEWVFEYS